MELTPFRKLHIGGKCKHEGWEVLDANPAPHIDHVCNAKDLSQFENNTFSILYASHVVEHFDYKDELLQVLIEWNRVLVPNGSLFLSVPDLDILSGLLLQKDRLNIDERFDVMRMIFGAHDDNYDYHLVGLNEDFLNYYLCNAGFTNIRRVINFGIFNDSSCIVYKDSLISLNMIANKKSI